MKQTPETDDGNARFPIRIKHRGQTLTIHHGSSSAYPFAAASRWNCRGEGQVPRSRDKFVVWRWGGKVSRFSSLSGKPRRRVGYEEKPISAPHSPTTPESRSALAHAGSAPSSGHGWQIAGALQIGQAGGSPRPPLLQSHRYD